MTRSKKIPALLQLQTTNNPIGLFSTDSLAPQEQGHDSAGVQSSLEAHFAQRLGIKPSTAQKTTQLKEIKILWNTFLIKDWDLALNGKCSQLLAFSVND